MSDYSKLKELAEAASEGAWVQDAFEVVSDGIEDRRVARCSWLTDAQYIAAANPVVVLGLIAENERLTNRLEVDPRHDYDGISTRDATVKVLDEQVDQLKADNERLRADYAGLARFNPEWDRVAAAQDSVREHMAMVVQLKAEVAGLRTGYEAYEQVKAELKAEIEALRKDAEQWRALVRRAESPVIGYTGCVTCGVYTDHGGLSCPKMRATADAALGQGGESNECS